MKDGIGGQGRGRPRTRIEVEATIVLHLRTMMRTGRVLVGGRTLRDIEWGLECAPPVAAVRLTAELGQADGRLSLRHPGDEPYVVQVVSAPQPFGGRRWWMLCPVLGVRTATLYLPPHAERFASRQAHGLGYRSQRVGARGRVGEASRGETTAA